MGHQLPDQLELLKNAAADVHGRVRLEAIVASSWLKKEAGLEVVAEAALHPLDDWMVHAHQTAVAHLNGESLPVVKKEEVVESHLKGADFELFVKGKELYEQDGYCATCHQTNGKGLEAAGFPPLAGTRWVLEDEERLIKIALKGLFGPIEVLGKNYPGQVPMTPYEGLLDDDEMSAVLTYVRNAFGNRASVISSDQVRKVRAQIAEKEGFYAPSDL
jgi:mono/diheme cytochrome c family protein